MSTYTSSPKRSWPVTIVALLAVFMLAAASWSRPASAAEPDGASSAIQLTERDSGKTISVRKGQQIIISLPGNPTTGFTWNDATKSDTVKLSGKIAHRANGGAPGSPGVTTATFVTSKIGTSAIVLEYKRVFEDKPAAKTFTVKLVVEDQPAKDKPKKTYKSPNGKAFPANWGEPPRLQTRDLRPLPGGYGRGSSTLAKWIQENLDRDAQREEKSEGAILPPVKVITGAKPGRGVFKVATRQKPLVIKSATDVEKHFSEEALAKLQKQIDFEKQIVLIFAWRGSGQDKLTFDVLESFPEQVVFKYTPGRTKDLRPHVYTFVLRSNVKWRGPGGEAQEEAAKRVFKAPNGKPFPAHWGEPPRLQTFDLRPLPGGYGRGSGTLARWIQENLDRDAKGEERHE